MSRFTAMMSARGTITSAMRRSRSPRMLRSMVRSMAEKLVSSGVVASSTTWRSARSDPGFHPNSERIARMNQVSDAGRRISPCCTGTGRLRGSCVASPDGSCGGSLTDGSGSGTT